MSRYKYKVCFLGDTAVGKTSIITRLMYNKFDSNYQATVGADFLTKSFKLNQNYIKLQLWDTAGQEKFRSLMPSYIRNSSAAIIVYDITNRESFNSIDYWIEDIRNERGDEAIIYLVGNKTDDPNNRLISIEELEKKAKQNNCNFLETSAKVDHNVNLLFEKLCTSLVSKFPNQIIESNPQEIEKPKEKVISLPNNSDNSPQKESKTQNNCFCVI
ncbi:rab gtpase [Anaeramoeba ignava]|uniref:Rab gtpase n=1 Tax=Anaeramoeba ignava TaxID=1746090 RepID=A0A9Q0LS61_ANAIG|nr:rab gtpase [Anaeramoeba ignava]